MLSQYLSQEHLTDLGLGGSLANTPWVWSINSNLFCRDRGRRNKRKLEGRRIYTRIFPVGKFAQTMVYHLNIIILHCEWSLVLLRFNLEVQIQLVKQPGGQIGA